MKLLNKSNIIIRALIVVLILAIIYTLIDKRIWNGNEEKVTETQNKTHIFLSWWGNDVRHLYTMEGVDLFQEKNPDIDVSYRYGVWSGYEKRTKVWMESHNEADVMQINFAWLQEYSPDGTGFYDLNKLSEYIDFSNYTEEELEYGSKNGVLNAIPIAMNTHTFYYNQDILDEYGMDVPLSWEDFEALGKRAKKDNRYALGFSKKQLLLFMIAYYEQNHAETVFNEDGTLNIDEKGIEYMLDYYKKLMDDHVICPIDSFDRAKYMSGDIIGTMCWISDTKLYCDDLQATGVNVSRGHYPVKEGAERTGWYIKPATMWAISANTPHPEEAAKLLNYLVNDPDMAQFQQTEKGVPVSDAAIKALTATGLTDTNEYKATEELFSDPDNLHLMIPNMESEAILDAFKSGADEYLYDKMELDECALKIYKDINKAINGE